MLAQAPAIAHPITWKVLEDSRNQAVLSVLADGLASSTSNLRHRCLATLVNRSDEDGFRSILLNWDHYDSTDIELIRTQASKFAAAARDLLQNGSLHEKTLALKAVSELDLIDAANILLNFVLNEEHSLHQPATECLLSMCRRWGRDARRTGFLSNPHRQNLLKSLLEAILENPNVTQLMEAWLLLVHWDDAQQRGLLADAETAPHVQMLVHLENARDPQVLQLLAGYFWRATTPSSIRAIVRKRLEPRLAVEMATLAKDELLDGLLERLRGSDPLACMKRVDPWAEELEPLARCRLLLMMAASRDDIGWVIDVSARMADSKNTADHDMAARLLGSCRRPTLEQFVRLLHADTLLPSNRQLLSSAVSRVLSWLDRPNSNLQLAARHLFHEFTLEQLFSRIGHWPSQFCKVMADIVGHTDTDKANVLTLHLQSPSPKKRLAALQIVEWLDCADLVLDQLALMLRDPKLEVRVRAIDTLSILGNPLLERHIPELLQDANTDIAEAAHRAVRRRDRHRQVHPESLSS